MLFLKLTPAHPLVVLLPKRALASTAYSWQSKSVARLRQEAKARGLSVKGNKAMLTPRLERLDTIHAGGARNISNQPSVAPGRPQSPQPLTFNKAEETFLYTLLPDISQPDAELPIQIPYVPDFWDSSPPVANGTDQETLLPKLLVVAGDTHPGGGPSHNLLDIENTPEGFSLFNGKVVKPGQGGSGLLDDIVEDVGLPPVKDMKKSFQELFS
ncbi:uncharacterized protein LACBIDRAFT_292278 [Laccaria bicolor S238N-H82]|uniref:Predicted protein n=1 Tax=Laccaria bicolor (strain S238N-H82 / ATCC MYA-4686) TaxID=486041 RepID=B0CSJ0_LACBS|nr:uncharacterized protein LACBIDRAFT_292278 [Laccaria bicolor S238N-H82]EDR14851.1 predicted protein [Laccaria bicolor S238N-H82]|eukprot:XP_001875410.1 predicted protein [Laccaria bicolor S238N-H82]